MLVDPETGAAATAEMAPEQNVHLPDGPLADLVDGETNGLASASEEDEYTILVPTTDLSTAGRLIQIAGALMPVQEGEARGRVLPLGVVEIPEEIGLSAGTVPARIHRQMLGRLRRVNKSPQIELRTLVRVHRQVWQGIIEAAKEENANLILLGWSGRVNADSVLGTTIDEAVRNAPCDIAVAKGVSIQTAKRILVPIRGGPHAALAFKLATGLAERVDGIVTALRIERPGTADGAGDPDEGTIASRERDREEFEAVLATAPSSRRSSARPRRTRWS
jgi:nucleotide-binding universal stress UspA family protein